MAQVRHTISITKDELESLISSLFGVKTNDVYVYDSYDATIVIQNVESGISLDDIIKNKDTILSNSLNSKEE